jgi:uncharacterized membrane protein
MIEQYLIIILLAMIPTVEALGAIAVGVLVFHLNPALVFVLAFASNTVLFFPVYFILENLYGHVSKYNRVRRFVEGVRKKGERVIARYGFWGIAIYLATPFPGSGTWTGTGIAWLLGIPKKKALLAVVIGVFCACVFALLASLFAAEILYWFGAPRASPI